MQRTEHGAHLVPLTRLRAVTRPAVGHAVREAPMETIAQAISEAV